MFNDDDFSFLTGGQGDLDNDGTVDLAEYLNEEDDYRMIMNSDDDYSVIDDDDFESDADEVEKDWKRLYLDTAEEYGLDPDDYDDKDEFLEALEEAYNKAGDDESSEDKKVEHFCVSPPTKTETIPAKSIEQRYYDRNCRKYRIGDAIYDNFKEVRDNYEKEECEEFNLLIEKIYSVNKKLGISIWVWAMENFKGALTNRGVDKWDSQAWSLTDCIFSDMASIDNESEDENERTYILRYVSQHPELEETIYHTTYVKEHVFSITKYVPYCVENNLRENFVHVYNGIMTNRFRDEKKMSRYSIIEELLTFCSVEGIVEANPWFYAFFEKEIKALNKPLKEAYLFKKLNKEEYGKRIFLKPEKENLELDDEYFGKSDTTGEISVEEHKKLKNESKALKSKITKLENTITDLKYNIQRLEADLAAKRKAREWDGKYYRYCKVSLDESPNDLWYRTDDITIKRGDYVFVPFGYRNEELMAKVVLVKEFRSDDLPFPLERTKFICYKCEE